MLTERALPVVIGDGDLDALVDSDALDLWPSLYSLASTFFEVPPHMGFGEERISCKMTKYFHRDFDILYYPITFRSVMRVAPPLQ